MRHEGGLRRIGTDMLPSEQLTPQAVKDNSIGKIIEAQKPFWFEGQRREYHMASRDWIANEIFRRLDPKGRLMGEFIREEINPVL